VNNYDRRAVPLFNTADNPQWQIYILAVVFGDMPSADISRVFLLVTT